MQNPHEDQPVDSTREDYQNAADLFPSLTAAQNNQGGTPQKPASRNRRKFISLLAVGTVGLVTAVTVGGVSFAREIEGRFDSDDGEGGGVSVTRQRGDGDDGDGDWDDHDHHPRKKPTPSKTPTGKPSSTPTTQPTKGPTPQPTQGPGSTPTPTPKPTGTVVGSTTQATNTAVAFTNPADGQPSWLVHLGNGNFVAVEQACTHAGVAVRYNPNTGQFNCPAHGAIFNADGTNPQSPATTPLPSVHVTVNANGTITVP